MEVKSYQDLQVWQKAMDLVETIYRATSSFPKEEIYGLTSQLRRAAVSIPSNIAEGSSRRSTQEFIRYINIASGSLAEVETQMAIAFRLGLLQEDMFSVIQDRGQELSRMLFFLHRALHEKQAA